MPCKTATVPGPKGTDNGDNGDNGDGSDGGDDGGGGGSEPTPSDIVERITSFAKDNPAVTAGIAGAGVLLIARPDKGSGQTMQMPRPQDYDREEERRR